MAMSTCATSRCSRQPSAEHGRPQEDDDDPDFPAVMPLQAHRAVNVSRGGCQRRWPSRSAHFTYSYAGMSSSALSKRRTIHARSAGRSGWSRRRVAFMQWIEIRQGGLPAHQLPLLPASPFSLTLGPLHPCGRTVRAKLAHRSLLPSRRVRSVSQSQFVGSHGPADTGLESPVWTGIGSS